MVNRANWLIIKEYLEYLRIVKKISDKSVAIYRNHLKHLLLWAMEVPLWDPNKVVRSFENYLADYISQKTGQSLSLSSWQRILGVTSRFYFWGKSRYPKKFSNVSQDWIDGLVVPKYVHNIADSNYVSLDVVHQIKDFYMKSKELVDLRDSVAAIFLFISGLRAGAFSTLPIKAVIPDLQDFPNMFRIRQWPELGVKTKNSKRLTTHTFTILELARCCKEWDTLIRGRLSSNAMWFTPLKNNWGDQSLSEQPPGVHRSKILNRRLKRLSEKIGYPYQSAQKFRRGHAHYGLTQSKTLEQYKNVSLNLGHSSITITDQYYSKFNSHDRMSQIASLSDQEIN
jgi:integrase